jgi:DNA-binding response OmpR family regulator
MPPAADAPQSAGLSGAMAAPRAAPATVRRTLALWSDDGPTARLWCERLGQEGLHVRALPPRCDLAQLADVPADALIMVTLQGMSEQLQRVRELRGLAPWTPLLVACSSLRDLDQVLALELGADDVLDAAWSGAVVAARLRACGAASGEPVRRRPRACGSEAWRFRPANARSRWPDAWCR